MTVSALHKALAVTAELTGTSLSEAAARVFVAELRAYPLAQVLAALERCRRELRGRLTLVDILERVQEQDGRLSADEAWALCPRSEAETVVWTDEIAAAWGRALPLLESDEVGARMAFRKSYERIVHAARERGVAAKWRASLGHDPHSRESVLREAVCAGRLSADYAQRLLPHAAHVRDDLGVLALEQGRRDSVPLLSEPAT